MNVRYGISSVLRNSLHRPGFYRRALVEDDDCAWQRHLEAIDSDSESTRCLMDGVTSLTRLHHQA